MYPTVISRMASDDYGNDFEVPVALIEFESEVERDKFMSIYETAMARIRDDCESYENGKPLKYGNDKCIREFQNMWGWTLEHFCYDFEDLLTDLFRLFESMTIKGKYTDLTRTASIRFESIHYTR